METLLTRKEIDIELNALYTHSKHWVADIDMAANDIKALKDVLDKYLLPYVDDNSALHHARIFDSTLNQQQVSVMLFKNSVAGFLQFIDPMMEHADNDDLGACLVEAFTDMQKQINIFIDSVQQEKRQLFLMLSDAAIVH